MIPIPVPTNGRTYASVFIVFLFCWPLLILINDRKVTHGQYVAAGVLIGIMIGSYILNYVRCSTPVLSYWGGLCLIAGVWRSGCVQITALVMLPLLFLVNFWLLGFSLASLFVGKQVAQRAFLRTCLRFCPHEFRPEMASSFSEWMGPGN